MRMNVRRPLAPAGYAAVLGLVAVLVAVGLLVARKGLAFDAPVADGDGNGHFAQPSAAAEETAQAMRTAVRAGTPAAASPAPASAGGQGTAAEAAPLPYVGTFFYTGQGAPDHGCTGTVVHSPRGDVVVTAAHCVHQGGFRTDLAFVPGYHDGTAPYGVWLPVSVDVDPAWADSQDPDHDVAYLRVRAAGPEAVRRPVERLTGAATPVFGASREGAVRVLGYPNGEDAPVACAGRVEPEGDTQLRFPCPGLPNGTSGSPFLTGDGRLVGVLGGKDTGGDDEVSYSPYLGGAAERLYRRATGLND
ncbi:hypothetical protein GCM10010218_26580 [Streptomyces mashuensis]|uniref:Peptidase S1 domain-containing protein n=1 Tax=Streptomyces mashuensis TaxID=33904 RepID=A0A919B3B5_9ACTN|nr:serine protease [Streptomyces mashuensis]GHF43961.1 hypothetical protein GCM10010218_26580 [Streptomyces mashuensis]